MTTVVLPVPPTLMLPQHRTGTGARQPLCCALTRAIAATAHAKGFSKAGHNLALGLYQNAGGDIFTIQGLESARPDHEVEHH